MRSTIHILFFHLVALAAVASLAGAAEPWTGANWIWDDPQASSDAQGNDPRYIRHAFELPTAAKKATVQISVDNSYELFVNGKKIGSDGNWNEAETYDVTKQLQKGKNVLAVKAQNAGGPAGAIVRLFVILPDEKKLVFGSGGKWKVSTVEIDKWTSPELDDSRWPAAIVLGDASSGPWNIAGGSSGSGGPQDANVSDGKITGYRPASEELEHFILPEGFQIELVVSEPQIINPVCVTLDEQGRMFVSESHTYRYGAGRSPVKTPTNPIVRLDPLPDGKGYKRVLVAEGFDDPVMGMAIRDGKLWCTANNYLYTFDLTDEGPAKNKQVLLTDKNKAWNPFGMFVLEWGPAGDLYLSVGNHNIDIGPPDQEKGQGVSGRGNSGIIARMNADGTEIQRLVHGLRVPYSFDFDPYAQLWLLSNGQGNPNRFVRVIDGVDYHCYSRGVSNEWLAGRHPLAPPCIELPRGACTQLLRYYGAAFPQAYQGSLFLDNWGAHGFAAANRTIHRYVPDDRNNIVTKEDFLVCRDPHFRCSHVLYDVDGNLLIADWYGRDDESDLTGRIWKVSYTGDDKPELTHRLDSPKWNDWPYVLSALGSPHHLIRQKGVETVVNRYGDGLAWPLLAKTVSGDDPLGSAHALWALVRIGTPKAMATIYGGTQNPDWRVRRMALRLMRRYEVSDRDKFARQLLEDKDPAVRLEAALTLTDANEMSAALAKSLTSGAADDEHLRYEAAWHLARVADQATFVKLLRHEEENVRLAGLIAIDVAAYEEFPSHDAAMQALAGALSHPGQLEMKRLLELAGMHRSDKLTAALRELVQRDDVAPSVTAGALLVLRKITGKADKLDEGTVRRFLESVKSGTTSIQSSDDVLTLLQLLESDGPSDFALDQIGRRIADKDPRIRSAAMNLAVKFSTKAAPLGEVFWSRILDPRFKTKPEDKLDYLATLLEIEAPPQADNWRQLLDQGEPLVVRDALRSWRKFEGNEAMIQLLTQAAGPLAQKSPPLREDLAAVAAALKLDGAKFDVKLPPLPDNDDKYAATALTHEPKKPNELLGRRVFERTGCVKCHTTVTENTERAPSLKGIGKSQKVEYLLESVLDPSKVIKTGFETETVITAGGKIYSGLVKEEGDHLRIIMPEKAVRVAKADVDERTVQKKSLMPDGQHRGLSGAEFRDLIAYLRSLK